MGRKSDILKGFLVSFLVSIFARILAYTDIGSYIPVIKSYNFNIRLDAFSLIISFIAISIIFAWLLRTRRPLYIYNGRVGAMKANVSILKMKEPKNRIKKYILSTRVSFWPACEDERARSEFREILTKKISGGVRVERIWQIHNIDDLNRLFGYLELYKSYDNYSVKCFIGKSAFIPEILSIYGKVVSVSIPQAEDPRRLTTAFHFRGKSEIFRWEDYFKILWEISTPIKVGNNIYDNNIDEIKRLFHS